MLSPLLVTGTHRSGSTWVGRLLALSNELHYVAEPLNVTTRPSWLETPAERWYQFLDRSDPRRDQMRRAAELKFPVVAGVAHAATPRLAASATKTWLRATIARARGKRALIKDPFMVFNAPWFEHAFSGRVIFTVRHPAAFASSLMRLGWSFDFVDLVEQRELMEGPLSPWHDELACAVKQDLTLLEQACLLWRVVNGSVHAMTVNSPHRIVLVHEEFAPRVESELPNVYARLGLPWTPEVEEGMIAITRGGRQGDVRRDEITTLERDSSKTASIWRSRLSDQEIHRAERLAQPEFTLFYG